jgi:ADP-dependent NAD(P)H-hydrate dehydratase / NAD(P)H-hydrate epimerase
MQPVFDAARMREADRRTIEDVGLPGVVLMENAGAAVASVVRERFCGARRLVVLCGKGNNGGDGFVAARRLLDLAPTVALLGRREEVRGDALLHLRAFERSGGLVEEIADEQVWEGFRGHLGRADLLVDALVGTGLQRPPEGLVALAIRGIRDAAVGQGVPVVAIDLPSGLPSDGGGVGWETVPASMTVTFAALKHGLVESPACESAGEVIVAPIGIPASVLHAVGTSTFVVEEQDAARAFPARRAAAHKGDFGHVLVVAGSMGKTGAAVLAALGALRSGAGLVTVATPAPALPSVAGGAAEIMTEPLPVDGDGHLGEAAVEPVLALCEARDALVLGPGLGQAASTFDFVRQVVRVCPVPLVLDADGLNALAAEPPRRQSGLSLVRRDVPVVLTPHPGEAARLLDTTSRDVQAGRRRAAIELAAAAGSVVLLKGHRSVAASPDGRAAVCREGNPGMATGGSGDVLSGVLGALVARGTEAWHAACAGAFVHGRAGDIAARTQGLESLVAGDIVAALPAAIVSVAHDHS